MGDAFDDLFGSSESPEIPMNYPGSSRKRIRWDSNTGLPVSKKLPKNDPIFNPSTWGKPTAIEVISGYTALFYRPNVFAKVIGKSGPTLKFWESKGFLPKPPFRFRFDNTVRNYYNSEVILSFLELMNERGLLHEPRIDWASHPDLPDLIRKSWEEIRDLWLADLQERKNNLSN